MIAAIYLSTARVRRLNGIRTRVLALKGLPSRGTNLAEYRHLLRQQTLAGGVNITLCHALSSSDYLKRPQKRPHVAAKTPAEDARAIEVSSYGAGEADRLRDA